MIEAQKKKYGWEFLFIGANIDAVETARVFGIDADRAVDYRADSDGTQILYETVSNAVCELRSEMPLSRTWSKKIKEDYKNRK